ncbi:MAG: polysaccharide lyase family 7 protein [Myxococcota bacterium]
MNAGFEKGLDGWTVTPAEAGALDRTAHGGASSIRLTRAKGFVSQTVTVEPNTSYQLIARVQGRGNIGVKVGGELYYEQQRERGGDWAELRLTFRSDENSAATIFGSYGEEDVLFDDFQLFALTEATTEASTRVIARSAGGYGLSPDLPPGRNFDLLGWKLNTPSDEDNNGKSDLISEVQLAKGATDERYFFTGPDGGMVFRCPIAGARTSKNTKFTRTELREMLRRGDTSISTKNEDKSPNKNNWVFSSAPEKAQKKAGGVDGVLRATLAVNHVTTTGDANQVGRVVIGQIHGAKDEPVRIYYRKLPGHQRGSIYIAHEPASRDDLWIDLIGSRADDAEDPADGFALDEKFSYVINATGNLLTVTILQDGKKRAEKSVDMSNSGYDVYNEYLYFKAGVYIQDSTGAPDDYAQATFYELEYEHGP